MAGVTGVSWDRRFRYPTNPAIDAWEPLNDVVSPIALAEGSASQEELDAMAEALTRWGEHPDAFFAAIRCAAIGWV